MSESKPHIRSSEIDTILEQVEEKRGRQGKAPAGVSDDQLDAILLELGIESAPRRPSVEPILLPARQAADAPQPAEAAAKPAPEAAGEEPAEAQEPSTWELPDLKSYSEEQARRQAQERARIYAQARREAAEEARRKERAKPERPEAPPARPEAPKAAVHKEPEPAPAPKEKKSAGRIALTDLVSDSATGEIDERFRKFFENSVIDDPTADSPNRRREKPGFFGKLFARRPDTEEDGDGDEGEYYESDEGFTGEFEKLPDVIDDVRQGRKGKRRGADAGDTKQRTAAFSASVVANAITGTDPFGFSTKKGARRGYSVDVDIPLSRRDAPRGKESAPQTEEGELEEYSSLSDAPVVSGELARIRETRLVRTAFTGVLALALLYFALSAREGWLPPVPALDPHTAPLAYLVTNLLLLLVAAFSSFATVSTGLAGLFGTPTVDSFASLATLVSLLQNAALLFSVSTFDPEKTTLFAPVAALVLCGNALGKWVQMRAVCENFALASSGDDHEAAFILDRETLARRLCEGLSEEEPHVLLNRPTALVKGFLRQSFSAHIQDAWAQRFCQLLCGAGVVCAVVCGVRGGVLAAFGGLAGAVCLAAPFAATLACAVPTDLLQRAAARCGAVVPGPSAVRPLRSANTVLLRARDLFPAGSVRLHGIKTFEKERIDLAILYAASLLHPLCATLRGVFMGMLDNNEKLLEKVENASAEIGYGFVGWIGGQRILLGSREMMRRHSVETPSLDYENRYTGGGQRSAIYLSVGGKLFGMFVVSYQPSRRVAEAVHSLADQSLAFLVQTEDFNITAPLVAKTYDLPENSVKVLSQVEQDALEEELGYRPESEGVMIHSGACASLLGGLHAAFRFDACERFASAALAAACSLGALLAILLSFYQGLSGVSMLTVLIYQAIWTLVIGAAPLLKKP